MCDRAVLVRRMYVWFVLLAAVAVAAGTINASTDRRPSLFRSCHYCMRLGAADDIRTDDNSSLLLFNCAQTSCGRRCGRQTTDRHHRTLSG